MRNQKLYLQDILTAIESIEIFIQGISFAEFSADDKTLSAVVRKLEIIGEAVKNLPTDLRDQYPDIPWKEMGGMRNILIHAYFRVDENLVWQTVTERFPVIKPQLEKIWQEVNKSDE